MLNSITVWIHDLFKKYIYTCRFLDKTVLGVTNRNKSKYLSWGRRVILAFSSLFLQRPAERRVCAQGREERSECVQGRQIAGKWEQIQRAEFGMQIEREREKERKRGQSRAVWSPEPLTLCILPWLGNCWCPTRPSVVEKLDSPS